MDQHPPKFQWDLKNGETVENSYMMMSSSRVWYAHYAVQEFLHCETFLRTARSQ